MIIKYFSNDGEEFDTKEECEAYEQKRNNRYATINNECDFYDAEGKLILIDEENTFDKVWYVECHTNEAAQALEEYLEECECITLFKHSDLTCKYGRYYYDQTLDTWHDVDKVYALAAKLTNIFNRD